MNLRFDATKAVQAAAVIARLEGKRISRLRLLKLLYIADRESLKTRGSPMLGSKSVAMDNGPLHSDVYDMIKGTHAAAPRWSRYFTNTGRDVRITREPDNSALSRFEVELITEVVERHRDIDDFQLSVLTHQFEEWATHQQQGTS
ncbi:MAG: SocA family protein, partial [Pirellulales bacterium]|nr:SocA family protein [Pirellulales bacterium]